MSRILRGLVIALTVCLGGPAISAAATPPQASECAACHGANGMGNQASGFPALAGLPSAYLQAQLAAFKNHERGNAIMGGMATPLTGPDMAALGDYYAALPVPAGPVPPALPAGPGADLAQRGDWQAGLADGIPSCDSCHGPGGAGVGAQFPRLAGQPAVYLAAQLNGWRDGTRKTGPLGLMSAIAHRLSPAQISAVAAYYAALPANTANGAKP
ncbi:cytochrome c [Acidocella aquatica]|uniref:Cytochrome c n=1 Tax=Acidocella aquatica TaxID=1922313 RepID=A0ABQ6A8T0_9PROT|nr:c-type cytochrome [Acidocella aquatica]GLR68003.1 cytochrome c [Acidocella aquatica]